MTPSLVSNQARSYFPDLKVIPLNIVSSDNQKPASQTSATTSTSCKESSTEDHYQLEGSLKERNTSDALAMGHEGAGLSRPEVMKEYLKGWSEDWDKLQAEAKRREIRG